jgi:hypothetical protein
MLQYLKYLPLLSILAKHPNVVKAISDSIPDIEKIAAETQQAITEFETAIRQIEGLPT